MAHQIRLDLPCRSFSRHRGAPAGGPLLPREFRSGHHGNRASTAVHPRGLFEPGKSGSSGVGRRGRAFCEVSMTYRLLGTIFVTAEGMHGEHATPGQRVGSFLSLVEAGVLGLAAALHFGLQLQIGEYTFATPFLYPAAIVEAILALALLVSVVLPGGGSVR